MVRKITSIISRQRSYLVNELFMTANVARVRYYNFNPSQPQRTNLEGVVTVQRSRTRRERERTLKTTLERRGQIAKHANQNTVMTKKALSFEIPVVFSSHFSLLFTLLLLFAHFPGISFFFWWFNLFFNWTLVTCLDSPSSAASASPPSPAHGRPMPYGRTVYVESWRATGSDRSKGYHLFCTKCTQKHP